MTVRLAAIGGGEQTRRTHLPCLELALERGREVEVVVLVDLAQRMPEIARWVAEFPFTPSLWGLSHEQDRVRYLVRPDEVGRHLALVDVRAMIADLRRR